MRYPILPNAREPVFLNKKWYRRYVIVVDGIEKIEKTKKQMPDVIFYGIGLQK